MSELSLVVAQPFLDGFTLRPARLPDKFPVLQVGLVLGNGPSALEVLVTTLGTEPPLPALRSVWKARRGVCTC